MIKWLTEKFGKSTASKDAIDNQTKELCQQLHQALKAKDRQSVMNIVNVLHEADEIRKFQGYSELVTAAIRTNDVEIFKAVFGMKKNADINYMLNEKINPFASTTQSMLYAAIDFSARDVALFIAERPGTDVLQSGHITYTHKNDSGDDVKQRQDYISPLELAQKRGMYDIAAVIELKIKAQKAAPSAPVMIPV